MLPDRHDRLMADVLARAGAIRARRRRLRALAVLGSVVIAALVPVALGASDDSTSTSVIAGEPSTTAAPSSTVTTEPSTTTSIGGQHSPLLITTSTTETTLEPPTTIPDSIPPPPPTTTTSTTMPPVGPMFTPDDFPNPRVVEPEPGLDDTTYRTPLMAYEVRADGRSARLFFTGMYELCWYLDRVEVDASDPRVVEVAIFYGDPPTEPECPAVGVSTATDITFDEALPRDTVIVDRPR